MKKYYIAILLVFLLGMPQALSSQYYDDPVYEPTDEMGFIISGGYKHLAIRGGSVNAFSVDLSLYNFFSDINFNGGFQYGRDYINFEPFSLLGMMCFYFVKYGEGQDLLDSGAVGLLIGAGAMSSMSFNIRIGDYLNVRPYWSLFRLSKMPGTKYELTGGFGSHVTVEFDNLTVGPYYEWTFGWKKGTPFKGHAFGLSVGLKLF